MEANNASVIDPIEASGKHVCFNRPLDVPSNFSVVNNETSHNDTQYEAFNFGFTGTNGANEMNNNNANGWQSPGSSVEDGTESTSSEVDFEVPFRIYVDLGPRFPIDRVWQVFDEARQQILRRIRRNDYRHGPLDVVNGNVLLFEGEIPATALGLVDGPSENEFVHRHLENWLLVLLDLEVQDVELRVPFTAGCWHMAWCRR